MKFKTVIVTGCNGYIGSACVKIFLKKNYNVIGIDAFYSKNNHLLEFFKNKRFKLIKGRVEKINKLIKKKIKIDGLIHTANIVGEESAILNKRYLKQINVINTKVIAKFCNNRNISKFIFLSTCSLYGVSKNKKLLTENSKINPIGTYAKSKQKSEKYLLNSNFKNTKILIIRLGTLFGIAPKTRFDLIINDFIKNIYYSKILKIYEPYTYRPYIHVMDAAISIERILSKISSKKEIINLNSLNLQKIKLVNLIKKNSSKKTFIELNKNKLGQKRDYKVSSLKAIKKFKLKFKYDLLKTISEINNFLKVNNYSFKTYKNLKRYGALYKVK